MSTRSENSELSPAVPIEERSSHLIDLLMVLFVTIVFGILSIIFDFYEYIRTFSERMQGDNLLLSLLAMTFALFWYSYRRWIDSRRQLMQRRQAEADLLESQMRFQSLFNNPLMLVYEHDFRGRIISANDRTLSLLGYQTEEFVGMDFTDFMEESDVSIALKSTRKIEESGADETVRQYRLKTQSGASIWVEAIGIRVDRHDEPTSALIIARDIRERKKMEEEKKVLQDKLLRSQKLETIGRMAGGIAHDFNNILTPILGFAEMAADELDPSSQTWKDLQHIIQGAQRARDLVRQILTFSRQVEQERKPLMLHIIIKEALKLMQASIPPGVKLEQNIRKDCPPVLADPTQTHQIIVNLCTNAFHAMKDSGGTLRVSLDTVEPNEVFFANHPNLENKNSKKYVQLTVSDTGHGIEPETLNHIFEPFFTTKPIGEGTGLGLSVVHGIVTGQGGDITVESTPGEGTTFEIVFPAVPEDRISLQETRHREPIGKARILFVDDDPSIVQLAERLISRMGFDVEVFSDPEKALQTFEKTPEIFDLLITDYTMPDMTGDQLAEKMLGIRPDLPMILITGFSQDYSPEQARERGFSEYLMKPLDAAVLNRAIRHALD